MSPFRLHLQALSAEVFTPNEERLAVELYVPRGDEDEEILQHLQRSKVELGDEVCTRLLVQKVRSAWRPRL